MRPPGFAFEMLDYHTSLPLRGRRYTGGRAIANVAVVLPRAAIDKKPTATQFACPSVILPSGTRRSSTAFSALTPTSSTSSVIARIEGTAKQPFGSQTFLLALRTTVAFYERGMCHWLCVRAGNVRSTTANRRLSQPSSARVRPEYRAMEVGSLPKRCKRVLNCLCGEASAIRGSVLGFARCDRRLSWHRAPIQPPSQHRGG